MIPAEAVEAAAKALFASSPVSKGHRPWGDQMNERIKDQFRADARAALEAAAPHMQAGDSQDAPYPDGPVTCVCGETFRLYWNGGELDQHDCKCGRKYYGEHRDTVMVIQEPTE